MLTLIFLFQKCQTSGNKHSPTVIAAAITSQTGKAKLPTHIEIDPTHSGLKSESIVLTEQIRTIDKSRLKEKIGHIDDEKVMTKINDALGVSFGINQQNLPLGTFFLAKKFAKKNVPNGKFFVFPL